MRTCRRALLGAVLATPFIARAQQPALELLQAGTLSAATEGTFPPFSMTDPRGNLDGLEIRVVRDLCRRIGVTYRPVVTRWEAMLVGLAADQFDITSTAMDITPARQEQVTFVDGWLESGGRLLVHRGDATVNRPEDIRGKAVGALVASNWHTLAEGLGATVRSYRAETDAIQDLVNRQIAGVVTDAIAGAYAISASGLPLRMLEQSLSSVQKGFAVKKGKPNLVRALNGALAAMHADGTYARLTTELVGFNPAPANPIRSQL
jgi:polar amino acid transport system substrate-binding protein